MAALIARVGTPAALALSAAAQAVWTADVFPVRRLLRRQHADVLPGGEFDVSDTDVYLGNLDGRRSTWAASSSGTGSTRS
jgi:hypothetical protein